MFKISKDMNWRILILILFLVIMGSIFGIILGGKENVNQVVETVTNDNRNLNVDQQSINNSNLNSRDYNDRNLIYAVKDGQKVTVWQENLSSKNKSKLLEYEERKSSTFSGNVWQGLPPSITLSPDKKKFVYTDLEGVMMYDIDTKETTPIISKLTDANTDFEPPTWSIDKENEKSGIFGFYSPKFSYDQKYLSLTVGYYEGSANGIYDFENNSFVILKGKNDQNIGWHDLDWSKNNYDIVVGTGEQVYSERGLFVTSEEKFDQAENYSSKVGEGVIYFRHPSWSSDSSKIVFSYEKEPTQNFKENPKLGIINRDGTGFKNLIADGNVNDYTLFTEEGIIYYFKDSGDNKADGVWVTNEAGTVNQQIIVSKNPEDIYQPLALNSNYLVILVRYKNNYEASKFHNQIIFFDIKENKMVFEGDNLKERITFLGFIE